jgi:hypothetical protein
LALAILSATLSSAKTLDDQALHPIQSQFNFQKLIRRPMVQGGGIGGVGYFGLKGERRDSERGPMPI